MPGACRRGAGLLPTRWLPKPAEPRARRLRRSLEDLGPIFIKFGQLLSTRRDLLPEDLADELSHLQDNVAPFPAHQAQQIIERALGRAIGEIFADFDPRPLASASVAQVHPATLFDGREVVVKVIRPDIERTIREDISLLLSLIHISEPTRPY